MITYFKLYDPILQKVRLGNFWDGGYVLPIQCIARSKALVSYGVGTDISFERDYIEATGNHAYCYDHTSFYNESTISIEDRYRNNIHFYKQGLSSNKTIDTDNFFEHYKQLGLTDRVLFKADIEGAETEYLLNTDIAELSKLTTGLVFEFHYYSDPTARQKLFECMRRLNEYYYLCHIHGNNYRPSFVYDEQVPNTNYIKQYSIPDVIEVTYVNKDLVRMTKYDNNTYPNVYLDRKNDLSKDECDLNFLKLI